MSDARKPVIDPNQRTAGHLGAESTGKPEIEAMTRNKIVLAAVATILSFGGGAAFAHCDSIDGPVARAAERALSTGNVLLILPYAPAAAEPELHSAFASARKVRVLNEDARALADRSFMETAVRLHRLGEGASYTGLKPATDHGPAIPAAEKALESGDTASLRQVFSLELEHILHVRLEEARALRGSPIEPATASEVEAARKRVSAELEFVAFAEGLRQAIAGNLAGHHE
jgi:hypothetical protein